MKRCFFDFTLMKPVAVFFGLLLLAATTFAGQSTAWLLLNSTRDDAVMTLDSHELDVLLKSGWKIDGTATVQNEPVEGSAQLHRLIRTGTDGVVRMLESDENKLAALKEAGFVDEGLLGYVAASAGPGRVPVVQFTRGEKRLWLIDAESQKAAEETGWKRQGIQFWLWPEARPVSEK